MDYVNPNHGQTDSEPGGRDPVIFRRPIASDSPAQLGQEVENQTNLIAGKPTVAANNGSEIPQKLLRAVDAADVSSAEWIRLPAPRSRCRITGLSRTSLNEAIGRGDVRAITVRQPGATRGIKLINRRSLLGWLARLEVQQSEAKPEGGLK